MTTPATFPRRLSPRRLSSAALLALAALFAAAAPAAAQGLTLSAGAVLDAYRFGSVEATGIRSLSLMTLPVAARQPLGERFALEVHTAWARASLERADGTTSEIAGPTDTELRMGARFAGDVVFQLEGIVQLPTGHATHTDAEAEVAGAVAADLLPFRISNWGSGGGVGMHTSVGRSFGATGLGVSGSYIVGREFEPIDGEPFGYRPGHRLRIRGAADHDVGAAAKVSLTVTVDRFSDDALDGANLFRSGDRVSAVASYAFAATPRTSALLYGGAFHRNEGTALLDWATAASSQTLLLAGGGVRVPMGWGTLAPSADVRVLRSADGVGQGYIAGLGAAGEMRRGAVTWTPSLRARLGTVLVQSDVESGITGVELALSARFGGGR